MPYLNSVTTTQEVEMEIDLIQLAYDHIDSVDELTELLEGISLTTVEAYKERLAEKVKEGIYGDINDIDDLSQFIDNVESSITDEYHQRIIDKAVNKQLPDLVDVICSTNDIELQDALICILNQHPKSLHEFIVNKHPEIKLALIEHSQALMSAFI